VIGLKAEQFDFDYLTARPCRQEGIRQSGFYESDGVNSTRYLKALLVALPHAQTVYGYVALLPWNLVLPT
jgi:hypothetical protein